MFNPFNTCRYGDVQAKYLLGTWLCEGRGGSSSADSSSPGSNFSSQTDFDRGVALQLEAAAAGHARAAYNIGVLYLQGSGGEDEGGVRRDLAAAAVWFQKASALGEKTLGSLLACKRYARSLTCLLLFVTA